MIMNELDDVLDDKSSNGADGVFTARMRNAAKAMSPWMKFLAILTFVGGGFMIIGGLMTLFSGYGAFKLQGLFNAMYGGLYIYLGTLLLKAANSIKGFGDTGSGSQLETSFDEQAKFWKTSGIIAIVVIALAIIVGIIVAVTLSSSIGNFNRF